MSQAIEPVALLKEPPGHEEHFSGYELFAADMNVPGAHGVQVELLKDG
jgi:hypothetical protein